MTEETREQRIASAARILESVSTEPPAALRAIGHALRLDGGMLAYLGGVLDVFAGELEDGREPKLSLLQLRWGLGSLSVDPRLPELLERLEDAEEPPWPALRDALVELAPPLVPLGSCNADHQVWLSKRR